MQTPKRFYVPLLSRGCAEPDQHNMRADDADQGSQVKDHHAEAWTFELESQTSFTAGAFGVEDQGHYLWPGALPFCQFLRRLHADGQLDALLADKRVMELGAGIGLVSCLLAMCSRPRELIVTDYDMDVLARLERNLSRNKTNMCCNSTPTYVECLDWRRWSQAEVPEEQMRYLHSVDVLVGSDLVWDEEVTLILFQSARRLIHDQGSFMLSFVERSEYLQEALERIAQNQGFSMEHKETLRPRLNTASLKSEQVTLYHFKPVPDATSVFMLVNR